MAQREDYRACVASAKMRGKPIAVGGPFTHALPEEACADADWICFGEAEDIMEELAGDMRTDQRGRRYQGGSDTPWNPSSSTAPCFIISTNMPVTFNTSLLATLPRLTPTMSSIKSSTIAIPWRMPSRRVAWAASALETQTFYRKSAERAPSARRIRSID